MHRGLIAVTAVAVAVFVGGSSSSGASSTAASTVGVWLKEWEVIPSTHVVSAGKVTFSVANIGKLQHEFVVVRTDRAPSALAFKGVKADETGDRGEVEELRPLLAGRTTLTLAPGRYVLLCNLTDHGGHYRHGMFTSLIVR